jgi:hypothetical protein
LVALGCTACGVESTDESTGGLGEGSGGTQGSGSDECPSGTVIVLSDYMSTQIALSNLEGATQSASFISTGSAPPGLAFPLGGDVVVPSSAPASGRVVLLDRFGTNALTWLNPADAAVLAQLDVDPGGIESNPADYLEVSSERAYVSRWGHSSDEMVAAENRASDILVIDTKAPAILGRIPLPMNGDVPPRPGGMLRVGSEVLVALDRVSTDWATTLEAELIGLDTANDAIAWQYTITGHKNCGTPRLSPDGKRIAVACAGDMDYDGVVANPEESALLLFDATERPLKQLARFSAIDIAGETIQGHVAFASNEQVLLSTQTALGGESNNRWLAFDLASGEATTLLEAPPGDDGKGQGLVYTSSTCTPGCSDICLIADGAQGVLQRVRLGRDGTFELLDPIRVEESVGLPPRGIGHR